MRVRANSQAEGQLHLTPGEFYLVVGLDHVSYRVVDDIHEPILYPRSMFDVVEGEVPSEWVWHRYAADEFYVDPPELCAPGFYEDWFDRKPEAERVFQAYLERVQGSEPRDS